MKQWIPDYAQASVVNALVMSFSKICLNDSSVSDDDLSEALIRSLCDMLGEEEFMTWLNGVRTYRNMGGEQ